MRKYLTLLAGAAFLAPCASAQASLVACAENGKPIEVAIARWEKKRFVVRGWFAVPAGGCKILIERRLPDSKAYYYFARQRGGKKVWPDQRASAKRLCVNPSAKFALRVWSSIGSRCPAGYSQRGFNSNRPKGGALRLRFGK